MDKRTKQHINLLADTSDIDKTVGLRINVRRRLLKITQKELASQIGITFQQLQKYEQGINRVSAGRLWQISRILETDMNFFFDNAIPDRINDVVLDKDSLRFLSVYMKIKNPKISRLLFNLLQEVVR